jgi:Uma2 family endonuclease
MSTARRLHCSYDEYLDALELSPLKLEFWGGEILAMAGATPEHEALTARVIALLSSRLPAGCRPFGSNMKVRIPQSDVTLLPDASIACGKLLRAADDKTAITNPGLIIEVTSPSTESYDRGEKLKEYKTLRSVQAVWLVSHTTASVTVVERHAKTWKTTEHASGSRLTLLAPALTLDVAEIYEALEGL